LNIQRNTAKQLGPILNPSTDSCSREVRSDCRLLLHYGYDILQSG